MTGIPTEQHIKYAYCVSLNGPDWTAIGLGAPRSTKIRAYVDMLFLRLALPGFYISVSKIQFNGDSIGL